MENTHFKNGNKLEITEKTLLIFNELKNLINNPDSNGRVFNVSFDTLPEFIYFIRKLVEDGYADLSKDQLEETLDHENWHSLYAEKFNAHEGFFASFSIVNKKLFLQEVSVGVNNQANPVDVFEVAMAPIRGGHELSGQDFKMLIKHSARHKDSLVDFSTEQNIRAVNLIQEVEDFYSSKKSKEN